MENLFYLQLLLFYYVLLYYSCIIHKYIRIDHMTSVLEKFRSMTISSSLAQDQVMAPTVKITRHHLVPTVKLHVTLLGKKKRLDIFKLNGGMSGPSASAKDELDNSEKINTYIAELMKVITKQSKEIAELKNTINQLSVTIEKYEGCTSRESSVSRLSEISVSREQTERKHNRLTTEELEDQEDLANIESEMEEYERKISALTQTIVQLKAEKRGQEEEIENFSAIISQKVEEAEKSKREVVKLAVKVQRLNKLIICGMVAAVAYVAMPYVAYSFTK
ncbi:MAG: hypothetical protein JWO53_607 [Chlamydiia bacterium]|nr:hypothetical protein [Chlamydiia bacterium]